MPVTRTIPLSPMSEDKAKIIATACREWNAFLYGGKKLSHILDRATSEGQRMVMMRILRRSVMHSLTRSTIHSKLALHAVTRGLTGRYPYTPNTAFLMPRELVYLSKGYLILRIGGWLELAFIYEDGFEGYSYRVVKKSGKWLLDIRR